MFENEFREKYGFSLFVVGPFKDNLTKCAVKCPICGFVKEVQPKDTMRRGFFCDECARREQERLFLEEARKVHGERYDYSKTVFTSSKEKVTIICPEHGEFEQVAEVHRRGFGCPECSGNKKMTSETFAEKAREVHGDKYDYSRVDYKNNHTKVEIICPEHGSFWMRPNSHLNGEGCVQCYLENDMFAPKVDLEEAKGIYEQTDMKYTPLWNTYNGMCKRMKFVCPLHGEFESLPTRLFRGVGGCPACGAIGSNAERDVAEYVASLVGEENIVHNARDIIVDENGKIRRFEIDIYIPSMKVGVEVNGEYWHKNKEKENPGVHKYKSQLIKKNGIALINVAYREWVKNKEQVYNKIRKKIYGY